MKKIIASLLALSLMLFSLCACSGNAPEAPAAPAAQPASEAPAEAPAEAPGQAPEAAPVSGDAFDGFERPRIKDADDFTVGYLFLNMSSESMLRSKNQFEIECAHRGWKNSQLVYEKADNFRDAFENMINQDVDAIILSVTNTMESYGDLIIEARNRGIGVYSNDNQVINGIISNCTMPNGVAALELLYKVGEDHGWDVDACMIDRATSQVIHSRAAATAGILNGNIYPNMSLLDTQDQMSFSNTATLAYDCTMTWLQKYGDDFQWVITNADSKATGAAEAIQKFGDVTGEHHFVTGFDGGSQIWSYIRQNTPVKYTYSQPFEQYTHNVCEIIDQIQIQGLNPGDEGCSISRVGQTLYFYGLVTTPENVPAVGSSVHEAFDFYGMDPDDQDAWYNWQDGPGVYKVTE